MSNLEKFLIGTSLDEIGMRYTLKRFKNEDIYDFKRRVDFVTKSSPKNNFDSFSSYSNISLGMMEKNIIKIGKVTDSISFRFKVDSCFIYLYKVTQNEVVLDQKINYNEEIRYVKDLLKILDNIDYINYELPLEEDISYLDIFNLRIQDSLKYAEKVFLNGKVNDTKLKNILNVKSNKKGILVDKKNSFSEVIAEGDYYIDHNNGIIFNYISGPFSADISYYQDPFYIKWQPVKTYLFNDPSIDTLTKDNLLIEGELQRSKLNREGNQIVNSILEIDPLYWGE